MYIKLQLIATLSFFSFLASAQNVATITGKVSDNQGPIIQASVKLKEVALGAQTDVNGKFTIKNVKAGSYTLVISYIGYVSLQKKISVKAGQGLNLNLLIEQSSTQMQTVTVVGKTKAQEVRETGFAVNAIETKQLANTSTNLSQILNKSTGVKVREQGGMGSDFDFSINGLSGSAVKFFIDGVPLDIMGSSMSLNNIPVNLSERIEVYKGVVPVNLGSDALGGAVNIITNHQIANYLDLSYSLGSFNTNSASLTGQVRDKKSGLTFKGSGFFNYSDNNYIMKDVQVIEQIDADNSRFVTGDYRRFNDQYQSIMGQAEVGVVDKSWADVFFVGGSYSKTEKGIQTGTNQDVVYGKVNRGGDAYSISLRYLKKNLFTKDLDLSFFNSYSDDKYRVIDTALRKYYWDGNSIKTNASEMGGLTTISNIRRPKYFIGSNLSYKINNAHSLSLNYTLDDVKNENFNELLTDKDYNPGRLAKNIVGLSYQQNFFEEKLTNTFFGKYYGMLLEQPSAIINPNTGEKENVSDYISNNGYGIASRYKLTPTVGLKASYEKAYRLQRVEEVFGNGYFVVVNTQLKPENSNNYNLGGYWKNRAENHHFFVETGAFLRNAKDFISAVVYQSNSQISRYENTANVLIKGLETDVKYSFKNKITAGVNFTYQSTLNNTKYPFGSNSGTVEATYKNELPNRPWMFGNANLGYKKADFIKKGNSLQLNWDLQYTHWYYLTWENYGAKEGKSVIPSQYIQNASVSYSMNKGMYNISLECNNLTDDLAYDNFKLQKAGRSFFIKLHYFIK